MFEGETFFICRITLHQVKLFRSTVAKKWHASVRNKASPSDNDWLKLFRTDWFENLSDKFTLKQIVKTTVQSEKSWFCLTGFKTYFEHCMVKFIVMNRNFPNLGNICNVFDKLSDTNVQITKIHDSLCLLMYCRTDKTKEWTKLIYRTPFKIHSLNHLSKVRPYLSLVPH